MGLEWYDRCTSRRWPKELEPAADLLALGLCCVISTPPATILPKYLKSILSTPPLLHKILDDGQDV